MKPFTDAPGLPEQNPGSAGIPRWLLLGLLSVCTPLFFWGAPDHLSPRSIKQLWNLGHILYFAIATGLLLSWRPLACLPLPRQWLLTLTLALLAGVGIEILQYGIQRSPDWEDVARDMIGALLVLCFGPGQRQIPSRRLRSGIQGLASILLLWQSWPLGMTLIDELAAWRQFPLLAGFESSLEASRWVGDAQRSLSEPSFSTSGRLLKLRLNPKPYSGVTLKYFASDWRGYGSLLMDVYNPSAEPLWITCRIHDLAHEQGPQRFDDRFNQRYLLLAGWNRLEIALTEVAAAPRTRTLDLATIVNLGIFTSALKEPRVIYLDNVQLRR
jgi:hypothetical protein